MEHRWGHRSPVCIGVRLLGSPGAIGSGNLRDVSLSGGFVQTRLSLPVLTPVTVAIRSVAKNDHVQEVPAHVIRRTTRGLGLEWEEFAPEIIGDLLVARSPFGGGLERAPNPRVQAHGSGI